MIESAQTEEGSFPGSSQVHHGGPPPHAKNTRQDPEKGWVEQGLACRCRKLGTSPIALEYKVCGRQGHWGKVWSMVFISSFRARMVP